jgi:transposase
MGRREWMVVGLGELVVILELHRQGLSVSAIARRHGLDRKTVRKYLERGLEPPAYGPRQPRVAKVTPFADYLRGRLAAYPELTGSRLMREIRDFGYSGGYTAVKDFLREIRPARAAGSSFVSRPRQAARRRWISRISAPSSTTSPARSTWSGCSR